MTDQVTHSFRVPMVNAQHRLRACTSPFVAYSALPTSIMVAGERVHGFTIFDIVSLYYITATELVRVQCRSRRQAPSACYLPWTRRNGDVSGLSSHDS